MRVLVLDGCERGAGRHRASAHASIRPGRPRRARAPRRPLGMRKRKRGPGVRRPSVLGIKWCPVGDCDPVGSPVEEVKTCVAQKVSGSSHHQTACKEGGVHRFRGAPAAGPARQTHQPTPRMKKTCQCRPFRKRLKGFEHSTFCMASRTCGDAVSHDLVGGALVPMRHVAYKGGSPREELPGDRDRGGRAFRGVVGEQGWLRRVCHDAVTLAAGPAFPLS